MADPFKVILKDFVDMLDWHLCVECGFANLTIDLDERDASGAVIRYYSPVSGVHILAVVAKPSGCVYGVETLEDPSETDQYDTRYVF